MSIKVAAFSGSLRKESYTTKLVSVFQHLAPEGVRQVLVYLNIYPLQRPEFYLAQAADKFDEQGNLTDEQTKKLIASLWTSFVELINKSKF